MKKFAALVLAISLSLLLTGCIEIESVLTINKDGSGTIEETTLFSAQLSAMMAMATAGAGQPDVPALGADLMVSRDKAEAKAKDMGPGVSLKAIDTVKTPDGRQGQRLVYAFSDIGKVQYQSGDMKSSTTPSSTASPTTFTFSNGALTIRNSGNSAKSAPPLPTPGAAVKISGGPAPTDQQAAMIKSMFAGMRMALKVTAPSGIASTDATYVDGNTVTLLDLQLDKLFDNPDVLAKLSAMSGNPNMSPVEASEALKGIQGVRAEPRDVVTIKIK